MLIVSLLVGAKIVVSFISGLREDYSYVNQDVGKFIDNKQR